MAAITGEAIVGITGATAVLFIHDGAIMGMTVQTGEYRVIGRIRVTVVAGGPFPRVGTCVNRETMRESCAPPGRGCVTRLAASRECRGDMVRIRDTGEGRRVTGVAKGWRAGKLVGDVTIRALDRRMGASEREARCAVVKFSPQPLHCRMTQLAILRERCRYVIGAGCRIEFRNMARDAGYRCAGESALRMTRGAACRNMGAHQWKLRARMVERGRRPMDRSVA
jgi:hypothetical protein